MPSADGCPLLTHDQDGKGNKNRKKLGGFGEEPGILPLLWWHSHSGTKVLHGCVCPGKGCPREGMSVGRDASGKGCLWERMTLRRDVHGKGWPWDGMLLGKDAPRNGCPWDLAELGCHAPPITHHPLFQGRCHTSRVHRHAEDPTAPILQGQTLGEHVQSSLGGQIPLLTITIWQCHVAGGIPQEVTPKFLPILPLAVPCCSGSRCPASPPKPPQPRWSPGCWRC